MAEVRPHRGRVDVREPDLWIESDRAPPLEQAGVENGVLARLELLGKAAQLLNELALIGEAVRNLLLTQDPIAGE
jgi:hypothetical protein